MSTYSIVELRAHIADAINEAIRGEDVIITKGKKPLVKIVKLDKPKIKAGLLAGKKYSISDDFDSESKEINNMFYGE